MTQSSTKPLSASAMLKLLVAQGAGSKVELHPEHIAAFESALQALSFQYQVKQLAAHGPSAPERSAPARAADSTRANRPAREPNRSEKTARSAPPRPSEGSGAIWTTDEEERLAARWTRGDTIGQIAEEHKRSAGACFARLSRLGSVGPDLDAGAAHYLIKWQVAVSKDNAGEWAEKAQSLGYEAPSAAAEAPRTKPPAP